MRIKKITLVVVLVTAAAACADQKPPGSTGDVANGGVGGPSGGTGVVSPDEPIDWDNPIGGEPVNAVADLRGFVAFTVSVPSGLGAPKDIFAIAASEGDGGAVDFVYDLDIGRVVVAEFPWDFDPKEWDSFVASVDDASTATVAPQPTGTTAVEQVEVIGSAEAYALPDGRTALITLSEDGARADIRWLTGSGVEIVIQGPSLSKENVIELAIKLSAEA